MQVPQYPRRLPTYEPLMPVVPLRTVSVTCFVAVCTLYVSGGHPHEVGLTGAHTSAKAAFLTWGEQRVASGVRRSARDVAGAVPQHPAIETPGAASPRPSFPRYTSAPIPRGLARVVAVRRPRLLMGGLGRLGAG